MTFIFLAALGTYVACILVERLTRPRSAILQDTLSSSVFRATVFMFVFAFFFAISWRPVFACVGTIVLVAVFVAISRAKMAFIHEPLVFADIAFIMDIFRHPKLFYTGFLGPLFVLGALSLIGAAVAAFFYFEPDILEDHELEAAAAMGSVWLAIALAPFLPLVRRPVERWALAITHAPDAHADVARNGQLATLVADFLAWRGDDRAQRIARWPRPRLRCLATQDHVEPAQLIVVAQCESFLDFRRLDGRALALPALDNARSRAIAWGPLETPTPGGYTMRSEFSLLTGRPPQEIGFDRYYPYLNSAPYRCDNIAAALRAVGYDTVFIHPYYADFFMRHSGLPAIGFDRLIMLDDFRFADRVGDYVADVAVADRIVQEARTDDRPRFVFAATMENHGPWVPGRFQGLDDPVAIFKRHLQNADAMLGKLVQAFESWPGRVVLVFFGDHVPLLKAYADPFPDPRTDYVLIELGRDAAARAATHEHQRRIDELTWEVLDLAGLRPQ